MCRPPFVAAFALSLLSLMLALPAWASQVSYEKPVLEGPTLITGDYVREHHLQFEEFDAFLGRSGQFSLTMGKVYPRYLTLITYRDNTRQVIRSTTPPEYSGERLGDIRVRGKATVYSLSPSDHRDYDGGDWVEVIEKDAEMDFQTTLTVSVDAERTIIITHELSNTTAMPVASMQIFELGDDAQAEFFRLGDSFNNLPPRKVAPYPKFQRSRGRIHFSPGVTWDLAFIMGLAAISDEPFALPIPGYSFLRNGDGTGMNLTGMSVWLLSAKDNKFRLLKFGAGLGMLDRPYGTDEYGQPLMSSQPALTLQFAPVGIAFGIKESWGHEKAYTHLDRLRRHVYLDVGVNWFVGNGKTAWGPYIQTSACLWHCK